MSGVAAWATLTPSITKTTVNSLSFPTPVPLSPGGTVTGSTTTNSKVTNASQLGAVATAFLGSSLNYENAITAIPTTDFQGINASIDTVNRFLAAMDCPDVPDDSSPTPPPPGTEKLKQTACLLMLEGKSASMDR